MDRQTTTEEEGRTHNSTYKKLAVQWLNEALCFISSFVVADNFVLRNRQLLVAANRYAQCMLTLSSIFLTLLFMQHERID
jgi:hypothetical protein